MDTNPECGPEQAPEFTIFWARSQNAFRRLCERWAGGNTAQAEDALQEVALAVCVNRSRWRGESSFFTWSWSVALNTLRKLHRKGAQERLRRVEVPEGWESWELTAEAEASLHRPDDTGLLRIDLQRALSLMPEGYRTVLELHLQGHSHEEMAGCLGVSVGTSKSQLARGRLRLGEILENLSQERRKKI